MSKTAENYYQQGLALSAEGRHSDAIAAFEQALRQTPNDVRVLFALGHTADALEMTAAAEKLYRQVLTHSPGQLEAVIALANLLRRQGRYSEANALLVRQLKTSPDAPELWLTLGSVWREFGDDDKAMQLYRKALHLKPGYVQALGNLADMFADQGAIAEAFKFYQLLLMQEPKNVHALFSRALIFLSRGRCEAGWLAYDARLKLPGAPIANHNLPKWNGRFRPDLRLLLSMEQGIGDQLMFTGLVPEFAARAEMEGSRILLACEPRLAPLLARALPRVQVIAVPTTLRGGHTYADYHAMKALPQTEHANCFLELGSLPRLAGHSPQSKPLSPFLKPDPAELEKWRSWLQSMPRPWVGICWRSGKLGGLRTRQYAPLAEWGAAIRDFPGTLICAQYAATAGEIAKLESLSCQKIMVPPDLDQKQEVDRTTALLAALDVVVSAPTAVVWQAAAAGTEVARIQEVPSWTQLGTNTESFSACVRSCTAPKPGNWTGAFAAAQEIISTKKIGFKGS